MVPRKEGTMLDRDDLRPVERTILRRRDEGMDVSEIAARLRRSPEHVERIIAYTRLPGRSGPRSTAPGLRPLERRVLSLLEEGHGYDHMAGLFRRSAAHMRRVAGMAYLRRALALLG
jgi:DNA-binding CsgD family transcriptional regulator